MDTRPVSLNAPTPIDSRIDVAENVTDCRSSDPPNASAPIDLVLVGITTEVTLLSSNAPAPIATTPYGMLARPVQLLLLVTTAFRTINDPAPVVSPSVAQL